MTRMLMAMAMGLFGVGSARADWGGSAPPSPQGGYPVQPVQNEFTAPNTLMGLGHAQAGRAPDRYGLMPGLRKAFRVGGAGCDSCGTGKGGLFSKGGCSTCGGKLGFGHGGHAGHGGGYGYDQYPQYPPMMQGTLAFPNNQYTRSPRDWFMYEPGR
jgi:hypothetical protein